MQQSGQTQHEEQSQNKQSIIEQLNEGEIKKKLDKLSNADQQQKQETTVNKQELVKELKSMEFDEILIAQAIQVAKTVDQAVQYIISKMENNENPLHLKQQEMEKQQDYQDVKDEMDLKMGLGKIAAQVAHATLKAYKQIEQRADINEFDEVAFFEWMETGQKKIVVKVQDEKSLLEIIEKAGALKINNCYIRDAGLTQIAAGSVTVGALGPAPSSDIDQLTKHLKLL